jgi:putative ABC transport system permease protein
MWRLSLRDLQWRRRRFTIAVAATALVFAMTLLFAGVNASFHNETRRIVGSFHADRWLVAEGASGPFTTASVIPASAAQRVAQLPGVMRADPVVIFHSAVRVGTLRDVNLIGYRLGGLGSPAVRDGRVPAGPGEVVVDSELGLGVGEQVTVSGRTLRVVGVAEGVTYYFGQPTLFVPIAEAQAIAFGRQPLAMTIVTRGVPATIPDGLQAMSGPEVRTDLERPLASSTQTIGLLDALLLVVAAGIIGSILYLSALERVRDFAVLKATGASNRALLAGLALQALLLAAAAALLAVLLANLLAPVFPFNIEIPTSAYLRLAILALVVGLVATLAGLRQAVGVDPALAFGGR